MNEKSAVKNYAKFGICLYIPLSRRSWNIDWSKGRLLGEQFMIQYDKRDQLVPFVCSKRPITSFSDGAPDSLDFTMSEVGAVHV